MVVGDRDLVTRLIKQSILSLCRETVTHSHRLEIDAIICLTVDDQDQHVVKIHETIEKPINSENESIPVRSTPNASTYHSESVSNEIVQERCKTSCSTNENVDNESLFSKPESENVSNEPHQSADSNLEVKEEIGTRKDISSSSSRSTSSKGHLLKRTFQKTFRCTLCKIGFPNKAVLKRHMVKEHKSKEYHVCPKCGKRYIDIIKFQQHKRLHPKLQELHCSSCTFIGSNALMYHKHMLTHGPQKKYKCTHCNRPFSDPFMYTSHMKDHRGDEHVQEYNCCFCNKNFQTFVQFQKHEHTHVRSKQRKILHQKQQDYNCSNCSFTGSNALMYNKHMLIHGPKKKYKCTHCNRSFSDPFVYTSHMKDHRGDEHVQEYNCCFCYKNFQTFEKFQKHEHTHVRSKQPKKLHQKQENYSCSICSFTGSNALKYNKHMLIHGPKKKYKCTHCNLSFSDPFVYTSHMKDHKSDKHVQKYQCCFCNKTLQTFVKFQQHEHAHFRNNSKTSGSSSNRQEQVIRHQPKIIFRNLPHTSAHVPNNHLENKTGKKENVYKVFLQNRTNEDKKKKVNNDQVKSVKSKSNNKAMTKGTDSHQQGMIQRTKQSGKSTHTGSEEKNNDFDVNDDDDNVDLDDVVVVSDDDADYDDADDCTTVSETSFFQPNRHIRILSEGLSDANIELFKCGACRASFSLPQLLEKHLQTYPDHKL